MSKLVEKSYAERIPADEVISTICHVWYLPHHSVYHLRKPDKLQVVFDCSAAYEGISLNSHLLQGPDLTNNLTGVLLRFRQERTAIMADNGSHHIPPGESGER